MLDGLKDTVIDGRYRIEAHIASGGMGDVFRAWDEELGRPVALKVLSAELVENDVLRARFEREIRIVGALQHPNIVRVYDTGTLQSGGRDLPFLVMEFVEDPTLRTVIHEAPDGLPLQRAIGIAQSMCTALEYAHGEGILHRDLKPENVFVLPDDHVKVADFGLAKGTADKTLTRTGVIVGTMLYLPPELIGLQGQQATMAREQGSDSVGRSDLYQVGAILYEMLCATPLMTTRLLNQLFNGRLVDGSMLEHAGVGAAVPPPLRPILHRLLAIDPEQRYANASEVMRVLGSVATATATATTAATATAATRATARVSAPRRVPLMPVVGAVAVLFVIALGWVWHALTSLPGEVTVTAGHGAVHIVGDFAAPVMLRVQVAQPGRDIETKVSGQAAHQHDLVIRELDGGLPFSIVVHAHEEGRMERAPVVHESTGSLRPSFVLEEFELRLVESDVHLDLFWEPGVDPPPLSRASVRCLSSGELVAAGEFEADDELQAAAGSGLGGERVTIILPLPDGLERGVLKVEVGSVEWDLRPVVQVILPYEQRPTGLAQRLSFDGWNLREPHSEIPLAADGLRHLWQRGIRRTVVYWLPAMAVEAFVDSVRVLTDFGIAVDAWLFFDEPRGSTPGYHLPDLEEIFRECVGLVGQYRLSVPVVGAADRPADRSDLTAWAENYVSIFREIKDTLAPLDPSATLIIGGSRNRPFTRYVPYIAEHHPAFLHHGFAMQHLPRLDPSAPHNIVFAESGDERALIEQEKPFAHWMRDFLSEYDTLDITERGPVAVSMWNPETSATVDVSRTDSSTLVGLKARRMVSEALRLLSIGVDHLGWVPSDGVLIGFPLDGGYRHAALAARTCLLANDPYLQSLGQLTRVLDGVDEVRQIDRAKVFDDWGITEIEGEVEWFELQRGDERSLVAVPTIEDEHVVLRASARRDYLVVSSLGPDESMVAGTSQLDSGMNQHEAAGSMREGEVRYSIRGVRHVDDRLRIAHPTQLWYME